MKLTSNQIEAEAQAIWDRILQVYQTGGRDKLAAVLSASVLSTLDMLLTSEQVVTYAIGEIRKHLAAGKVPKSGYLTIAQPDPAATTPTLSRADLLATLRRTFPEFVRTVCAGGARAG